MGVGNWGDGKKGVGSWELGFGGRRMGKYCLTTTLLGTPLRGSKLRNFALSSPHLPTSPSPHPLPHSALREDG
uniref:Uncharacterized protein n=1 Tax=Desertifilum tharense IPPAS B-1220 TaxID=1781255 RepID=A0ACD5GNH2_9CYAN